MNTKKQKIDKNYSLIKDIRSSKLYKESVQKREPRARKKIETDFKINNSKNILPGQLIYFDYFEPKTKEDLEYYDARPVTLFFSIVQTEEGKRILGFNIHYFPPRIRYQILNKILEIYNKQYSRYWDSKPRTQLTGFNYKKLLKEITNAGLEFGVRMYIPSLIRNIRYIPVSGWSTAVYTEGIFKKKTREMILQYWKNHSTQNITKTKKIK